MPKAAVDEDRKTGKAKREIRPARQRLVAAPAGYAGGAQNRGELQLRGPIAARFNGGHHLAALGFCEYVGHATTLAGEARVVI